MDWLINRYTVVARTLAWIGILAIIVLSIVPANDRPVSGVGQGLEHFTAFALVGGVFAIGYRLLTNSTSGIGYFLLRWN